jgi:hypothetical protein
LKRWKASSSAKFRAFIRFPIRKSLCGYLNRLLA